MGRPFPHVQAWGRHCADNNEGAQRYLFSGRSDIWRLRHSASPGGGTHVQKLGTLVGVAIRSREEFAIDFPGGEARDLFLLALVAFAVGPLLVALHVGQVPLRGLLAQRGGRWGS